MSTRHRRIIRRPEGVEDSAWSRLADLLAAAVEQQRRLAAQSPNVLGPRSGLDTLEDGSLSFAHEPAEPSAIAALFDSRAAKAAPEMLLRWTAEVFSALSAAHGPRPGERPVSHGGICPGTILTTPGGQAKVTDFGFAPAFCQALGADAYVNLAIAPPSEPGCPQPGPIRQSRARKEAVPPSEPGCPQPGPTESQSRSAQPGFDDPITGIWEVLDPHTFDRDDRICGFIDPEKYGSRALGTFESGSDVIAAGFVLHLMAEHQHPYLYTDPDAHRLVEMSQFMGMGRFNGARRQDLRESTDPAVRLWCDLIAKTLSRLPKNRPTAAEIVQALSGEAGADQVAAVLKREAVLPKPPASRPPSEPASERPRETRREAAVEPVDATSFRAAPVRKRVLAIVVTLVVAIGAIGAWQFWPGGQAEQTSRVSANDNLSPPAPPIDRRLVENDAPEKPDDGPPDNTVVTPPAENENTSTPDEVVPIPANANQDPSPDAALVEGGEALTRRVVRLEERLDGATHEALSDIIARRSIDSLEKEVRAYWDRAHAAGAEEQSKIARGQATRLGDWMRKIASYERILIMADKPLDEQIRLLEAAQEDWSTPHVEKLLNGLPAVDNLLGEADRLLGRGEWRRARFAITQAADKAIEQNLGDLLSPVITAARAKLARDRRDQLADAFRDAAEWLALIGDPPDPVAHLARTEDAAAARNMLDRFDLDFPTGAAPSEVAVKAVEQGLLPWTELTDEERVTLQRLIAWTTFDWPVGESTLSLAFVQSASASGMLDPVWISQTEVTVGLYREVMGALPEPPVDKEAREVYEFMRLRADNPIAFVAPDQVQPFCEKIMAMFDNRIIVRLPIESEWTHALSAGGLPDMDAAPQLARFSAVEDGRLELDKHLANFRSDEKYLTFAPGHNDGFGFGAPVRSYPPNRWLIHDMLGNVGEWVTTTSGRRSAIGGSFFDRHSDDHRAPSRHDQTVALGDVGIRLVVIAAPSGDPAPPP